MTMTAEQFEAVEAAIPLTVEERRVLLEGLDQVGDAYDRLDFDETHDRLRWVFSPDGHWQYDVLNREIHATGR